MHEAAGYCIPLPACLPHLLVAKHVLKGHNGCNGLFQPHFITLSTLARKRRRLIAVTTAQQRSPSWGLMQAVLRGQV